MITGKQGRGRRQTSQKPGCEKKAPSTAAFSAAAFEGDVAGVEEGVESLRAMEGDAVHKDYLKLHRRATKSYWAQPASPSMARSDSTPATTPATSPSNAAAEKAAVEGAFFSQPGFWDV